MQATSASGFLLHHQLPAGRTVVSPFQSTDGLTYTAQRHQYGHVLSPLVLKQSEKPDVFELADGNVDLCDVEGSFCTDDDDGFLQAEQGRTAGFSYGNFAKKYPFANNIMIASAKTAAADLLAQVVIAQTPLDQVDWERNLLFFVFGALYLGLFQYAYQVNVFKRLFDVDKFTSQTWEEKLKDGPGLRALGAQTALDLTVLTFIYLPTFYIFKASVFSGSPDPSVWASSGIENYQTNFSKDEVDLIKVWAPADLVCFSVPLYLRLPVRHVVSFVWTAYLSFARGGH